MYNVYVCVYTVSICVFVSICAYISTIVTTVLYIYMNYFLWSQGIFYVSLVKGIRSI